MPGRSQRPIASRGKQGRRGKRSTSRRKPEDIENSTERTLSKLDPKQREYAQSVIGRPKKAA